jgi:hypothetical protein
VEDGKIAVSVAAKLADKDEAKQAAAVAATEKAAYIAQQKDRKAKEALLPPNKPRLANFCVRYLPI